MSNPVFDLENWREIGATLAQNKTRTLMTAFGVFWGTAILALLIGGSQGLKSFMNRTFDGFATNTALVFPGRTTMSYKGFNKGMNVQLKDADVAMIRRSIPEIDHLTSTMQAQATAKYGKKSSSGSLMGVESEYKYLYTPVVYEGRFLNRADDTGNRRVCVLGKRLADELFGVGSALGKEVSINDIYYKVVGVAGQTASVGMPSKIDDSVFIPARLYRLGYNMGDNVGAILFSVKSGHKPSDFIPKVRRIVATNHPVSPDDQGAVFVFDISENFAMVDNLFLGITLLAIFVGAGTLLSGIIGVGNIMWIIVRERTQEIGVRRALGAKPRDIITQILSEGVVLTLVAGVAGICLAALVLYVTELMVPGIRFQMSFTQALAIMAAFIVLGSCAGLVPAIRAMKIKPIEALNAK